MALSFGNDGDRRQTIAEYLRGSATCRPFEIVVSNLCDLRCRNQAITLKISTGPYRDAARHVLVNSELIIQRVSGAVRICNCHLNRTRREIRNGSLKSLSINKRDCRGLCAELRARTTLEAAATKFNLSPGGC